MPADRPFFSEAEIARRYARYRPKTHGAVIDRVRPLLGALPKDAALDAACGTGDSSAPLRAIARRVVGIDASAAMLAVARPLLDRAEVLRVEEADRLGETFDLVTVGLAFHWLDQAAAASTLKRVSRPGAFWLVYNFVFAGSFDDAPFDRWFRGRYLPAFPNPSRGALHAGALACDSDLRLAAGESDDLEIRLDDDALAAYFTTQSNIEAAVRRGAGTCAEIEARLLAELRALPAPGRYRYRYTLELFRFMPPGAPP
jgi:SAM-dependent methyltransferase